MPRLFAGYFGRHWLLTYSRRHLPSDLIAGVVTAALLVPQGLAYAMLAGLPPQVGLYASIVPPAVYALLGSSRHLSVGPVSVAALLVADALARSNAAASETNYLADALLLAAQCGCILLVMALLRLDLIINFLSHTVLMGFTSGAAVLIIISQLQNLTGIALPTSGSGADMLRALFTRASTLHTATLMLSTVALGLLWLLRKPFRKWLIGRGLSMHKADMVSRANPLLVIVALTITVSTFDLQAQGIAIVGTIPAGLPLPRWDFVDLDRARILLIPAIVISLIAYVESVSISKVLALRSRQQIDNRQELVALGAANATAAFSGGMPVAGGFSRSLVNYAAGAQSQLATLVAAALVALATAFFAPLFHDLPQAALAAVIVIAVAPLLDWRSALATARYDRADGAVLAITFFGVLVLDIESGLIAGVALAAINFMWRSSHPHIAIVGRLAGTQHYRNVQRHAVETWPGLLLLRVDRSLYFANVAFVETAIARAAKTQRDLRHLVIICGGVNEIDHSALQALEQLAANLHDAGITLHLAEVKGPVMDRLLRSDFQNSIAPGRIFLSAEAAVNELGQQTHD